MLAAAVPLGILVGWLRGGRLAHLTRLDGRAAAVVVLALVLRLALYRTQAAHPAPLVLLAAELALYGGIFAAVAMHRHLAGTPWVAAGAAANLLAIASHGGRMPVWLAVSGRVQPDTLAALRAGRLLTHAAMTQPHVLGWLGDVLALPAPLPGVVMSLGDVLIVVGVVLFLSGAMVRPPAAGAR